MHGGYPHATGYRLIAKNTNLKELIDNQEKYPLGDPDPSDGEFEKMLKGDITRKPYASIYPVTLNNYDMVHFALSGGPGYGDPLERRLDLIQKDLNDGIYTDDIVYNVYGVVARYDEKTKTWTINEAETAERQKELKREREEKSMTYEEFWQYEREKITEDKLGEHIARMFSESITLSEKWRKYFLEFWDLPENFEMEVN
jgi:hypothetical protein